MPNPMIAEMLARRLADGFLHPGDPENDVPPRPIILPFKPAPGMPEEMGKLMTSSAKLVAEAMVEAIETDADCEIVPRAEIRTMKHTIGADDGPSLMPIYCRCDTRRERPLAILTVSDPGAVVIEGMSFLGGLRQRSMTCPHDLIGPAE